ncbi:hypothetical protein HBA53_20175 [Rhodococcus pyridinivorans]|uniref:hypothetical protein n=1 Tax=Rhodococcus pyridinivorans TaxID=103816 RepID=UPI001C2F6AB0|nr:hypothetical protein [Rhodococcus pyridinivorans]QXF83052.1 hypothetical protein HBA53_20175 [Rhodococcus pyridinivorans]
MSENRSNDTGQISVAELLARNGQKVGTRAGGRRRRGASGGISVAELTGEIPITRADSKVERHTPTDVESAAGQADSSSSTAAVEAETPPKAVPAPRKVETPKLETPKAATFALSDIEKTTVTPRVAVETKTPPVKTGTSTPAVTKTPPAAKTPPTAKAPSGPAAKVPAAADAVSKTDTVSKTDAVSKTAASTKVASKAAPPKIESPTEVIRPEALPRRARAHLGAAAPGAQSGEGAAVADKKADKKSEKASAPAVSVRKADVAEPRLLSGPASDLQGTGADADDSTDTIGAAGAAPDAPEGVASSRSRKSRGKGGKSTSDAADDSARKSADDESTDAEQGSGLKQWALLIGESVAAIVAGGLLFKGFERLWDLMPWVAFALALLVIVGLVALVRVLRRTDDITSQLIALAVGAFVAFGPLLFLLPG